MEILNFEKVMQQVENGEVVEMVAYRNFHCEGNYNILYCKQGHRYIFKMRGNYYAIMKLSENNSGDLETIVIFDQARYKHAEREDLKRYIENHFCKPFQDDIDIFVEVNKMVNNSDDIDNINYGLRKLHNQYQFSISDRSTIHFSNSEQVVRIVGRIKASKLPAICEIFSEVAIKDEQISKTGYMLLLDVDIAEYDFFTNVG